MLLVQPVGSGFLLAQPIHLKFERTVAFGKNNRDVLLNNSHLTLESREISFLDFMFVDLFSPLGVEALFRGSDPVFIDQVTTSCCSEQRS